MNLAADKEVAQSVESAGPTQPAPESDAVPAKIEASSSAWLPRLQALPILPILFSSMIGAAIIVVGLLLSEVLVPAHVASELRSEAEGFKRQNDALKLAGQESDAKIRQYEKQLGQGSPEQLKSQIADMQDTIEGRDQQIKGLEQQIKGLEQQIEAARASEWPPLAPATQDALYDVLKDLPAREVWVGYADSGGRALAKSFSEVFRRLSWPQKYDILAVVDPEEGLWITPISDFSEEVKNRVRQSTGLEFQLFPHREQLPDAKQIGIIIGYRGPKDGDVP